MIAVLYPDCLGRILDDFPAPLTFHHLTFDSRLIEVVFSKHSRLMRLLPPRSRTILLISQRGIKKCLLKTVYLRTQHTLTLMVVRVGQNVANLLLMLQLLYWPFFHHWFIILMYNPSWNQLDFTRWFGNRPPNNLVPQLRLSISLKYVTLLARSDFCSCILLP